MESSFSEITKATIHSNEHAINHGAMMLCKGGEAEVQINFGQWKLSKDSFIIFYPGDIVNWISISSDYTADILRYSSEILRAASMNIEHEVYRELRDDRICSNEELIQVVVKSMFSVFQFYFSNPYTPSIDHIIELQLQSFFIGFADYMRYHPDSPHTQEKGTQRSQQLFSLFMQLLEDNYLEGYEVAYYSSQMNISRKYLGKIVREHTGHTAKKIIDDYRVEQLKLSLTNTTESIKEIAHAFHFTDQSAFTRYFKAHTRKNPNEYRKERI